MWTNDCEVAYMVSLWTRGSLSKRLLTLDRLDGFPRILKTKDSQNSGM